MALQCERMGGEMGFADISDLPLQQRELDCPVPLTTTQRRVWSALQERGGLSEMRSCGTSVRTCGVLDVGLLRECIEAVVRRHESLRTRITSVGGTPIQQIDRDQNFQLELVDLTEWSRVRAEREVERTAEEFLSEKIDLSVGPLFAAKLLKLSAIEHILMLGSDHIISDAASAGIVRDEIWTLYEQGSQGLPVSLPGLPVQFADYAVWQQRTFEAWRREHGGYWIARLSGAPDIELPVDDSVSKTNDPTYVFVNFPIGKELSERLCAMAWRERCPLSLLVLTVLAATISRWCKQRDFLAPFYLHGRHSHAQLANTTGFLAYPLYLRIEIPKDGTFLDLLRHVNLEFFTAFHHQDFGHVPDLVPACTACLSVNWTLTRWSRQSIRTIGQASSTLLVEPFPIGRMRFRLRTPMSRRLDVSVFPTSSTGATGIVLTLGYATDQFSPSTIEHVVSNLRLFAEALTQRPLTLVESAEFCA